MSFHFCTNCHRVTEIQEPNAVGLEAQFCQHCRAVVGVRTVHPSAIPSVDVRNELRYCNQCNAEVMQHCLPLTNGAVRWICENGHQEDLY